MAVVGLAAWHSTYTYHTNKGQGRDCSNLKKDLYKEQRNLNILS